MKRNGLTILCRILLALTMIGSSVATKAATEVHVEKAGTLSTLVTTTVTSLKLTGSINGTDIKWLRSQINDSKLATLDLSEVRIVAGGEAYYESYKAENDVIGQYMFTECSKLRSITLPATISAIQSNAFSKSGIRKADIPNSVTKLGSDAFAYCTSLSTAVIGSRVTKMDQGVFYGSSALRTVYAKPLTPPSAPAYLFSSNPTVRVYTQSLEDYKQSDWKQYAGSFVGALESLYPMEEDSSVVVNNLRDTFFEDAACTQLRASYQSMSDEALAAAMKEGGMPDFMTAIAIKLKNADWKAYEQEFRIHSYRAYSDASYWNDKMMSSGGSYMGNPTGIFTSDTNSPLYVFVDADVPEDATLYIAGCVDNDLVYNAKTGKKLSKGLNIVDSQPGALYYIIYTADTRSQQKPLSQWPEMKIHIEGGTVNGYYDTSRHKPSDYVALLRNATHNLFTVKGAAALFNFKTETYRKIWPSDIDRSICWFDSLTIWQKELMGMCESVAIGQRASSPHCLSGGEAIFPIYYNNPNFAIQGKEGDSGWANSTAFRTAYNSFDCVSASFDVSRSDHDDWCAGHECGHNNQRAINLEGGTEVSNNLFANVVRFLDGTVTSTGSPLSTVMDEYARHEPFFIREVNSQLRMYYQLYLYYHQGQRNTAFYPTLFAEFRKDPMVLWNGANKSSMKFVRKVCEVAQEDLTDFFTAWGFFEPCDMDVEDYGQHHLKVTQAEIDQTKAEISKYPKKNLQILFVEDRADYVLTTDFLTTAGKKRRNSEQVGQCGDLGQFTSYRPDAASQPSEYGYLQSDSLYAMFGNGGVGFLVLDDNSKMVYASNSLNFCIPTCAGSENLRIYSVDADGTLHEAQRMGIGTQTVALSRAGTLGDTLQTSVIKAIISGSINGTDIKLMRKLLNENNLQSLDLSAARITSGGTAYYQTYRSALNTVGDYCFSNCKQLVTIQLPLGTTKIGTNAFAKSGLHEIVIPDAVTTIDGDAFAYCDALRRVVIGSKMKTMGQGVFYNSAVKDAYVKALTPPSISAYLFSSNPTIHVYARALAAYQASAWAEFGTLVGDLDEYEVITAVEQIPQRRVVSDDAVIYDLSGRSVGRNQPAGIYIRRGKKIFVKP